MRVAAFMLEWGGIGKESRGRMDGRYGCWTGDRLGMELTTSTEVRSAGQDGCWSSDGLG